MIAKIIIVENRIAWQGCMLSSIHLLITSIKLVSNHCHMIRLDKGSPANFLISWITISFKYVTMEKKKILHFLVYVRSSLIQGNFSTGILKIHRPAHGILALNKSTSSEGSDKPMHRRCVTRALFPCIHKVWLYMKVQTTY